MRGHDLINKKTTTKTMTKTKTMTNTLENTFKERPQRLVTFETFDQSDEGTWPEQQKTMTMTKTNTKTKTKTMTKTTRFREHLQRATPESCDL